MNLLNSLFVSLIFILFSSSLAQDSDNAEYGSGIEDYSGSDPPLETPKNPDDKDEQINKIAEVNSYEGKNDNNDVSFGGEEPGGSEAEVRTSENMEGQGQFSIKHPAVLALIIGGIIFVLLIILLLVMFVVYRLRKKDEGSYALDENMKKKSRNIVYTKPPLQNEFFA